MKRFIITLFAIVFTQSICYAVGYNKIDNDSIKVEYQRYKNDTIYYNIHYQHGETVFCGLKQYEENLFRKFHKQYNQIDLEYLIDEFNSDDESNTEIIIKRKPEPFLVEYGIELSPWMTYSITSSILQRYLEKRVDFKYDEETVRFDVRLDYRKH